MKEIVDLQKKSLQLEREKDKYSQTVTEKTEELAKLQLALFHAEVISSFVTVPYSVFHAISCWYKLSHCV